MATTAPVPKLANYAHVRFTHVPEMFCTGSDVECSYTVSEQMELNARDWIGLYKVGWRSPSDYIYYMWSPVPANYSAGTETSSRVTFPGGKMPKDDGEFYQFCYVNSSGQVRGASAPFQFKQITNDDLIEIEDENGELLVIRTKTAVLEDQLKKAKKTHEELHQKLSILENEKALLKFSERDYEQKLQRQKEESDLLQEQLCETSEKLTDLQQETKDLQIHVQSLQEKLEILNQEKLTMEKRLDDNDIYIASLQDKIKTLVNDKDVLLGRTKQLEEEKALCQAKNTAAEAELRDYVSMYGQLRARISEIETTGAATKRELDRVETELAEQRAKSTRHEASSALNKESLADLQESLRNAEDKLEAAESCKTMLNEEVLTVKQAFEKVSSDLEVAKADADNKKDLLSRKTEEANALSREIGELRGQLNDKSNALDGSAMFALQQAQTVLKKRYMELQKKFEELDRNFQLAQSTVNQLRDSEAQNQKDVADMKARLQLGCVEYQKIAVERNQLQAEVAKLKQSAGKAVGGGDFASMSGIDLLRQMEEIQAQLDERGEKATKYRTLYREFKKKYEQVSCQLRELQQDAKPPQVILTPRSSRRENSLTANSRPEHSLAKQIPSESTDDSFDPLLASGRQRHLTPPLKPLPPPIQPQILPSAKVAAVKAQSGMFAAVAQADEVTVGGPKENEATVAVEEFVDALSEPPCAAACAYCRAVFANNEELDVHVGTSHEFYVCPMCTRQFLSGTTIEEFEAHVNKHFD